MLVETTIVLGNKEKPLMVLEKHKIESSYYDFISAYEELVKYAKKQADNSFTWGYFPELEVDKKHLYSSCIKLANQLQNNLIANLDNEIDRSLKLAFMRVAIKEPISDYGGLHIDVDIGIEHKRPINEKREIIRFLINPYNYSRKLGYLSKTRDELLKEGISISKTNYAKLNINEKIGIIEIPQMQDNIIYALKFWSSIVPHFGITDEKGHFLIAYGTWADYQKN